MAIENLFTDASSAMTVVSFTTFLGILWWTFVIKRSADFDTAARLPFADEIDSADVDGISPNTEKHDG